MPKLLIVDDEQDVREFAQKFFKKRQIETLIASGGREALGIIEKEKPDLVLLDVRMEEMNGVDVLKTLRSQNNSVKIIMVSGVENGETIQETRNLGVLDYIHKPLILDELEKIVLKELQGH
jgi:DNA-binding response OmpR family regulator